ncbi:UNVERIFIED_CONTAM: hypothetical protein Sradi_2148300 [Sesamum radiatum]|uniref:Uncharacterized protein n=1 Tax=Sesamum radiatum TaxID=300843 RepID=A0AAW2TL37_SESRA
MGFASGELGGLDRAGLAGGGSDWGSPGVGSGAGWVRMGWWARALGLGRWWWLRRWWARDCGLGCWRARDLGGGWPGSVAGGLGHGLAWARWLVRALGWRWAVNWAANENWAEGGRWAAGAGPHALGRARGRWATRAGPRARGLGRSYGRWPASSAGPDCC